ncbi:MAG: hypothetical protein PHC38_07485 [Weeksellaceae bacterium]|nr:hypothetical protein [Weeksellaceae bacterium]
MKLYDLIKSNNWLSVEITLLRLYPDQINMIDEYRNVFEKLKFMKPEENDMSIVLTEYDNDVDDESEIKTHIDVSGRKEEKEIDSLTDSYALEFVEWKEWLGMDLATETIKNFNELEIISHCLFEMTFMGYEEKDIKEQLDEITKRIDEYKYLTEEEKKLKTISFEEIKNRLDEKDGNQQGV